MPWILVLISVGVFVGLVLAIVAYRRRGKKRDLKPEEWISLGVVFLGAGVALSISAGPAGYGMMAVGAVYLFMGTRARHHG